MFHSHAMQHDLTLVRGLQRWGVDIDRAAVCREKEKKRFSVGLACTLVSHVRAVHYALSISSTMLEACTTHSG